MKKFEKPHKRSGADAVLVEIVRNGVIAMTEEMKSNLIRTAYSMIIYEAQDFTVGLFDARGDTVSIGIGLPMFVGDFSPVAGIVTTGGALVANPGLSVTNLKELVDYRKRQSGKLGIRKSGLGSAYNIAGEFFKKLAEVDLVTVPCKGGAPALTAAVSGEVPLAIVSVPVIAR